MRKLAGASGRRCGRALNDDDILCAVRSAAAETFGNDIVTAGGWPETKQRMALVDALVTKTCERLTESLAALAMPSPNDCASSPADARIELVQKEVGEGLREAADAVEKWANGWKSRLDSGLYETELMREAASIRHDEGVDLAKHLRSLAAHAERRAKYQQGTGPLH